MSCMVCHLPLSDAPYVQWFTDGPYRGAHHLVCPDPKPPVAPSQRELALKAANKKRVARAKLKRDVAARRISIIDALSDPAAEGMALSRLLIEQPRWGDRKVEGFLRPLLISPFKLVGALSDRQRRAIIQALSPERKAA